MSVEATGWAFRQKIPPKPKMVLMALADQADETTGRVCYGKADMGHLAVKASVPERSLYRYINALVRNGYVIRNSGKEKGKPNSFWLCLDRARAETIEEWQWAIDPSDIERDVEHEPQDIGGSATMADPAATETEGEGLPRNGRGGLPLVADQESSEEPKNIRGLSTEKTRSGFSRETQDLEIEQEQLQRAAAKEGARVFVLEGSRAWFAWCTHRGRHGQVPSLPVTTALIDGRTRHGWWLPSLFPPQEPATGPPTQPQSMMTKEDEYELASNGR